MNASTTLVVHVTEDAQTQLREILAAKNQPELAVRVFAQAAGPGAAKYGMALDADRLPDDREIAYDGFIVIVDAESADLVRDAVIDFEDGLVARGFTLLSPHYTQPTGCGGGCGCGGGGCGCGGGGGGCGCGNGGGG
jgi:iron-sulfur cluster assembly accessory protein